MAVEGREGNAGERGRTLWPEDFGERLERFMEMAGLSRRGLAERLGVTEDTVGRWLEGVEPSGGNVWAMFRLSRGVPGGLDLLLYGHAHYEGEAEGQDEEPGTPQATCRRPYCLTTPWGSRLDALRLRAVSRIPKARWRPSSFTPREGPSSCLRRAWAMRSAIWSR